MKDREMITHDGNYLYKTFRPCYARQRILIYYMSGCWNAINEIKQTCCKMPFPWDALLIL